MIAFPPSFFILLVLGIFKGELVELVPATWEENTALQAVDGQVH